MTTDSPNLIAPKIVPSQKGSFIEMWSELRSVPYLYVPLCMAEDIGISWHGDGCAIVDQPNFLETLDSRTWTATDGYRMGIVFTDPQIFIGGAACIEAPTATALERYFHNINHVSGVSFNTPMREVALRGNPDSPTASEYITPEELEGFTVHRFFVPRIIGFLRTGDPFAEKHSHAELAKKALAADKVYQAYAHAALARENGEALDEYYFAEAYSLFYLSLHEELSNYFPWYFEQGGKDPRHEILKACLLSISGRADEAINTLNLLPAKPELRAAIHLEKGRYYNIYQEYQKALSEFDQCLALETGNTDAHLGKGIALRTLHYQDGNREGFEMALSHLRKVADKQGYHAPEALHHSGTIYLALSEYAEGEKCFAETIAMRESPVSRRNMILCQHAQGKLDEAKYHYEWLLNWSPEYAEGLEKYFSEKSFEINPGSHVAPKAKQHSLSPQQAVEACKEAALKATTQLKEWSLPVQGDIMDFRRLDEYLSYHAPGGVFLESCAFANLSEVEVDGILAAISMHLNGVLTRRNLARWLPESDGSAQGSYIIFKGVPAYSDPISMYDTVWKRFSVGATADNLTNLDMLVSLFPDYDHLAALYSSPIKHVELSPKELSQYQAAAKASITKLHELGFNFNGELSDLKELDDAINEIFEPGAVLRQDDKIQRVVGEDIRSFGIGLGLHLGFVFERFSGQTWMKHMSIQGISLQGEFLNPFYPVQRFWDRAILAQEANQISALESLVSPLVCADLARKFAAHEVNTRAELAELLKEALPSIMEDDPSGQSLDRMVTMIMGDSALN